MLIGGLLLLILGVRIFVGIRFISPLPQLDDWWTVHWLQAWSDGVHNWAYIWQRKNDHPLEMYFLTDLVQYLRNGYWDARLDFLDNAVAHTIYALVVFLTFRNVLATRDRAWVTGLIFFIFVIPFAGYRINWGILWPHSAMLSFSLLALYLSAFRRDGWTGVGLTIGLAWLAAFNLADGCLAALLVAGTTLFRAGLARRITSRDIVLVVVCLAIFITFYLGMTQKPRAPGIVEAIDALLRAVAWPVVFSPLFGLLTLIPFVALGLAQIISPSFRTRSLDYLLGVAGLLLCVSVATGVERGASGGPGMPSGRYTEIFCLVPLVSAVILCALYRGTAGRWKLAWGVFFGIWVAAQVLGFSLHLFYRTLPFIARENGEWTDPGKQVLFRDMSRGVPRGYFTPDDLLGQNQLNLGRGYEQAESQEKIPALTLSMIVGFPIFSGSQGNYISGGYLPSVLPRPAQTYMGSFDPNHREVAEHWFLSAPFRPTAPYITMDLLVDKGARFSNYRLPGLQLVLRDDTTGQRTQLLPQLAHSFPFVFRDWETVYAAVTPGHEYRIESYTTDSQAWIAFGEPFESGKSTPVTVMATQSGKLLCLCGLALLTLAGGAEFYGRMPAFGGNRTDASAPQASGVRPKSR